MPLFRDQPQHLLPVETTVGGRGPRRTERPVQCPIALPDDHPPAGRREDHPPAAALPLRPVEDRDVPASLPRRGVAASTIYRILKRLGMNRLPASQRYKRHQKRWRRYEKQRPGHQLQIHVKFVEPITTDTDRSKRKYYQYTAIDDCTRIRILRIYPRSDQKTAIQFLDYVLSRLPFQVEKIQTDNGAEFQSAFHWHVVPMSVVDGVAA